MRHPSLILAGTLLLADTAFAINPPPRPAAPVPAAKARAGAPLTDDEKYWLTPTELSFYEKASAAGTADDKLQALEAQTRHAVSAQLPAHARARYARLTKLPIDPKKVSSYLDALIAIRDPKDTAKLGTIKKGAGVGAHLQRGTALEDYQAMMATVRLGKDGRPLPGRDRKRAMQEVARFRGMLAGRSGGATRRSRTAGGDASKVSLDLTAGELDWLFPKQRAAYATAKKARAKEADRLKLNDDNRGLIKTNLRPDGRAAYDAAATEKNPVAINAAILAVKHYSGTEIQLIPAEIEALAAVTKDKVPALQLSNAKADYNREMAHIRIVNGEAVKPSEHLEAHEIAERYRKMLTAAGITVPGAPVTSTDTAKPGDTGTSPTATQPGEAKLTPELEKRLSPEEKAAYDKDVADAKGDPRKLAAVYSKYRKLLAPRSIDAFNSLTTDQRKDVCAPYKNAVLNGSGASVATGACDPAEAAQKTLACNKDKACMSRVAAECGTAPAPKSSAPAAPALPALDPAVKSACAVLWADPDPTTGAPGSEKKPSVVGDVPPATACGGGVANPGAVAGTDKDCTPAAKKPDPNFYRNVANGMAFGMFGLILGSFFGGPLVMLAGAAILGGGAFALSRHLNKPKDGK